MCLIADYCNRVKTPTNDRKRLSGFQFILGELQWSSFSAKQYELWRFLLQQPVGKVFYVPVCADVHVCMCQERLRWWDMLLCCCGVGAPLGLSVLVCWFPAAQHFAGPRGDTGGTYDWAMQS